MRSLFHNGLFCVAIVLLVASLITGMVWGAEATQDGPMLTVDIKIFCRLLCVFSFSSIGILNMLAFWTHKRKRLGA